MSMNPEKKASIQWRVSLHELIELLKTYEPYEMEQVFIKMGHEKIFQSSFEDFLLSPNFDQTEFVIRDGIEKGVIKREERMPQNLIDVLELYNTPYDLDTPIFEMDNVEPVVIGGHAVIRVFSLINSREFEDFIDSNNNKISTHIELEDSYYLETMTIIAPDIKLHE